MRQLVFNPTLGIRYCIGLLLMTVLALQTLGLIHKVSHGSLSGKAIHSEFDHLHSAGSWACEQYDALSSSAGGTSQGWPNVLAVLTVLQVLKAEPTLPVFCLAPIGLLQARAPPTLL